MSGQNNTTGNPKSAKQQKFDALSKIFNDKCSEIVNLKGSGVEIDASIRTTHAVEVTRAYNDFVSFNASVYLSLNEESRKAVSNSFENVYKKRLLKSLNLLGYDFEVPNAFERASLLDLNISGAAQQFDVAGNYEFDNLTDSVLIEETTDITFKGPLVTTADLPNLSNIPTFSSTSAGNTANLNQTYRNPEQFEQLYNLNNYRLPNQNLNQDTNQNQTQNLNNNSGNMAQISLLDFYNLCARTFTDEYSGDPLALRPFINKIELVEGMCQNEQHRTTLKNFIMANVKGIAADFLPANPESIASIKTTLLEKIKHDNPKVVRGRMLALKADRTNLGEFTKKAEQLAESLRRSLILDEIPAKNANSMVIDDTIELCRSNTNSVLVKAGLIGYKFNSPKEVIAKFIVETRKETEEKQVFAFRQQNSSRNSNQRSQNVRRNGFQNQNGQQQNRNFNRNWNRNGNQNQQQNGFRGNGNYRGRGNSNNYRGRGNYQGNFQPQNYQSNRNVYYAENDQAPPSGAAQQNVQSHQADNNHHRR